jgi:alpha-tubulin suppressor-like RCC1 family protein
MPALDVCARVFVELPLVYVQTTKGAMIVRNVDTNIQTTLSFPAGERVTNFAASSGALMMVTSSTTGSKMFSYGTNNGGILMLSGSSGVSGSQARQATLLDSFMATLSSNIVSFKSSFSVFYILLGARDRSRHGPIALSHPIWFYVANGELHGWAGRERYNFLCLPVGSIEIFDSQRIALTPDTEALKYAPGSGDALDVPSHAAILENGNILAWNSFEDKGAIPTVFGAPQNVRFMDIRVGKAWMMLLDANGNVYTFGTNTYATSKCSIVPFRISHDFAGRVGQLGRNTGGAFGNTFGVVSGVANIVTIASGVFHPIACNRNGRCYLWGASFGFDGLSSSSPYSFNQGPGINLENLDFSVQMRAGLKSIEWRHGSAYLLAEDASLFAFGDNSNGQLCLGSTMTNAWYGTPQAVTVPGGAAPASVQSGYGWVSILTTTGEIYSCGSNIYGSFGSGQYGQNAISTPTPADLSQLGGLISQIAVGTYHTVLLTQNNELWSFGAAQQNGLGLQSVSGLPTNGAYIIAAAPTRMDQTGLLKDRKIVSIQAGEATFISAVPFVDDSPRFIASTSPTIRFRGSALYDNTPITRIYPVSTNQGLLPVTAATQTYFDVNNNNNLTAGTSLMGDVWFPDTREIVRSVALGTIVPRSCFVSRFAFFADFLSSDSTLPIVENCLHFCRKSRSSAFGNQLWHPVVGYHNQA